METKRIGKGLMDPENGCWNNNKISAIAVDYMVGDILNRVEPIKNESAEVVLDFLQSEYSRTGSALGLYISLVALAGEMQGSIFNISKNLDFTLGSSSASNAFKGEFTEAGYGDVDHVTGDGLVFLRAGYFPGAGSEEYRKQIIDSINFQITTDGNLLLLIKPLSRKVELSFDINDENIEIDLQHEAYYVPLNGTNEEGSILGPNVYFKDNSDKKLYKNNDEKKDWLKLLDILREPAIKIEQARGKTYDPCGIDIYGFL